MNIGGTSLPRDVLFVRCRRFRPHSSFSCSVTVWRRLLYDFDAAAPLPTQKGPISLRLTDLLWPQNDNDDVLLFSVPSPLNNITCTNHRFTGPVQSPARAHSCASKCCCLPPTVPLQHLMSACPQCPPCPSHDALYLCHAPSLLQYPTALRHALSIYVGRLTWLKLMLVFTLNFALQGFINNLKSNEFLALDLSIVLRTGAIYLAHIAFISQDTLRGLGRCVVLCIIAEQTKVTCVLRRFNCAGDFGHKMSRRNTTATARQIL